jgi:hypothetical protein
VKLLPSAYPRKRGERSNDPTNNENQGNDVEIRGAVRDVFDVHMIRLVGRSSVRLTAERVAGRHHLRGLRRLIHDGDVRPGAAPSRFRPGFRRGMPPVERLRVPVGGVALRRRRGDLGRDRLAPLAPGGAWILRLTSVAKGAGSVTTARRTARNRRRCDAGFSGPSGGTVVVRSLQGPCPLWPPRSSGASEGNRGDAGAPFRSPCAGIPRPTAPLCSPCRCWASACSPCR